MSQDNDESPKKPTAKVGYGNPPKEHRFKKGETKNPRGRPVKRERSLIPRQLRTDTLKVKETLVRMKTADGEALVTAYEAAMTALAKKAMSGHFSAMKLFLQKCEIAVQQHYDAHYEFQMLEALENRQ